LQELNLKYLKLYESLFPVTAAYVKRRGGNLDSAKDIFQDALTIYHEQTLSGRVKPDNESGYIIGITKHLWFKQHAQDKRWEDFDDYEAEMHSTVEEYLQPVPNKILSYLEKTGKKCLQLLQAFYYRGDSLSSIAGEFGFSGTRSATVQKYKCLEKVRTKLKKEEVQYADFFE